MLPPCIAKASYRATAFNTNWRHEKNIALCTTHNVMSIFGGLWDALLSAVHTNQPYLGPLPDPPTLHLCVFLYESPAPVLAPCPHPMMLMMFGGS